MGGVCASGSFLWTMIILCISATQCNAVHLDDSSAVSQLSACLSESVENFLMRECQHRLFLWPWFSCVLFGKVNLKTNIDPMTVKLK